jgi:carbonic anhydrase
MSSTPAQPAITTDPPGLIEQLLARNAHFAERDHRILPPAPRMKTCIVTCPDPRVDPAHVFGLQPGDAAVVRAAAGRVSPIVLQQLLFLAQTAGAIGQSEEGLELILMQHTDCGITHFLGEQHRDMVAAFLGCTAEELDSKSPGDPYQAIRVDLQALAANEWLPGSLSVTGVVYDVARGLVEVVERRSPLRVTDIPETIVES